MKHTVPIVSFCVLALSTGFAEKEQAAAERLFTLKVKPLLGEKCFPCHGEKGKELKGGFNLTTRAGFMKGGKKFKDVLVPGSAEKSFVMKAVRWANPDFEMPPKENDRLTGQQIRHLRDWINGGAPWPDEARQKAIRLAERNKFETEDGIHVKTSGGLAEEWTYRRYKWENLWAFLPVKRPAVPKTNAKTKNPIDAFIRDKIEKAGLKPAQQANPLNLIRRASFDLIGLPPTPKEIDEFQRSWMKDAQRAMQQIVDRLLQSKHYGERWGQHWLDVVRYADTSGFSNDWERSNAWRYRDYVIRSLNADKPYNRFIIEQIAGDELEPENPEMTIAAGFLRMGPWEHTAMSPDKISRQIYLDDVVNSIGQTFLSTPLRCAKCHDHKFDPIPTRDYYRIYAALATTQLAERPAEFLPAENRGNFEESRKHVQALLDFARKNRDALYARREAAARKWYEERGQEYVDYKKRLRLRNVAKPARFAGLSTEEQGRLKIREQDVRIWTRRLERFQPMAQSVYNAGDLFQKSMKLRMPNPRKKWELAKAKKMPQTHIYSGGSVFTPADTVTPGVLSGLQLAAWSGKKDDPYALPTGLKRRRLALARWIANPKNPLTARSIVNRVWQYHFGRGLAGNPNNFGATGKRPTHPELLDWLASEFIRQGWSLKKLHRLIMSSETWQQASTHPDIETLRAKDPNNHLLAVFEPRRLTAEELRDTMLSVSSELNPEYGGLPIMPEINIKVALAPRMLQSSLAPAWQPSRTPAERNRRSIYAYRVRGLADPLLEVFNKPNSNESCEKRDSASVTPQVFTLMNSDVVTSRSIAMALRLERETGEVSNRIERGCQLAFGRSPSEITLKKLRAHYESMVQYHQKIQPQPLSLPPRVTRSVVEEFSGDAFSYEERLDIYENYIPDKQAADVSAETRALADVCLLLFNSNEFVYVY